MTEDEQVYSTTANPIDRDIEMLRKSRRIGSNTATSSGGSTATEQTSRTSMLMQKFVSLKKWDRAGMTTTMVDVYLPEDPA